MRDRGTISPGKTAPVMMTFDNAEDRATSACKFV